MHVRSADCLCINFAQTNTSNLTLLDILREDLDSVLNGRFSILTSTFKDVKLLLAIQDTQRLIHATTDVLLRAIGDELSLLQATFDAENNLLSILGVLGEVLVQQMKGVELRGAVQLATVPEVGTQLESRVKGLKACLLGWRLGVPCHSW